MIPWPILIQLIISEGIPAAMKLWQLASSNSQPTQADWNELIALGKKTMRSQMTDALQRAGIPLDSPQAVSLLALTP